MRLLDKNSTGNYKKFIDDDDNKWCKSYSVWVAKSGNGETVIDEKYYKYSVTTSKHIGMFLRSLESELPGPIDKLVKDGTIKLVNLN